MAVLAHPWVTPDADAHRRTTVHLVSLLIILTLLEGVLRKWLAPGLATPLFFLRDPVMVWLLVHAGFGPWRTLLGTFVLVTAGALTLWGGIGYMLEGLDPIAYALGARNHLLYLPLLVIVATTFRIDDIVRLMHRGLYLAPALAALVIVQVGAPADAFVNQILEGARAVPTVADGIVRPASVFTATSQNVMFTALLVAAFIAVLFMGSLKQSALLLLVSAPAVAALAVLTGSRAIVVWLFAVAAFSALGMLVSRGALSRLLLLLAVALFAVFLLQNPFAQMFEALQARQAAAALSEGAPLDRALAEFTSVAEAVLSANPFGYGIGRGTPAVGVYVGNVTYDFGGERELARVVYELGPFFGLLALLFKFTLAALVALAAIRAARAGALFALPLAGFAVLALGVSQITFSALNGFFPYLAAGLVLAAAREAR